MASVLQKSQIPYAIVIGLDSLPGIQTARILAHHKIPVIAIAKNPDHYCCRTKVCNEILFSDTKSEEFIRTLEALGPELENKAVLFPCLDMSVLHISRHRQRLDSWYRFVLPVPEVVEMMMDKVSFYRYAQENGLPIPPTRFLYDRADAERAAGELNFPCILKPPNSDIPKWTQHREKAYKVSSPTELLDIYEHCREWSKELIVQEWIEGNDSNLYSCNCYLDAQSEPIVTFVARKLRQWPPMTGVSSLGEECRDDVVLHETVRLLQSTGYRGLGYVEIKRDARSGKYFILEPNIGRPTGRSAIAEAGGVELLYAMYCDAVGWPLPENLQQTYKGVKWISLCRDFRSALYHWRKGKLTLVDWWRSLRGRKAYAIFSWTDPGPFFGDLKRGVRLYLHPEARKKRASQTL